MAVVNRLYLYGVVFLSAAGLAGCSEEPRQSESVTSSQELMRLEDGSRDDAGGAPPPGAPSPPASARAPEIGAVTAADQPVRTPQLPPQAALSGEPTPERSMIVRAGESRLEVDSLEAAVAAVERIAVRVGGWIAHSSIRLGDQQWRTARLEVKLPSGRWDEFVNDLGAIGELRQLTTATEEVGEQFVDLTAQLANARRLEERYLELLGTRTGSLEDLLAVERELARVRERIEVLQGRIRYLSQRVAISTMVVNLEEETDLLATAPGSQPIREAFRAAWRNFLGVIGGGIALLGGVLPVAMLAGALLWLWRRSRRRDRSRG